MAVFKSTLSSFAPLERPYSGRMIEAVFAIVGYAETISTSKAPQFDPEDDIELEIRTRTANILAIDDVPGRRSANRSRNEECHFEMISVVTATRMNTGETHFSVLTRDARHVIIAA